MQVLTQDSWAIKSRYLLYALIISLVFSIYIFGEMFPSFYSDNIPPLIDVLFDYFFYSILLYFIYVLCKRGEVDYRKLFGEYHPEFITSKYLLIVIPLIGISLFSLFLISFWLPELVEMVITESIFIWQPGDQNAAANILSFFMITIIAPVIEETLFRGLLLTSIAVRWDVKKAVFISSIIFGIFHFDIIGSTIFGIVAAVLYLKTKSLFLPIILHITNNTIVFISAYIFMFSESNQKFTLNDFQEYWWLGAAGFALGVPWFMKFYKKNILNKTLEIPYFNKQRSIFN
jgi:uncharacterized protein